MDSDVVILVFDGFADWEPAYALTGLRRWGHLSIKTTSYQLHPVMSMGGIRIIPDCRLSDIDPSKVRLFILPGGDSWQESPPSSELISIVHELELHKVPIAGICGATIAMARIGLFYNRRHTSNGHKYLLKYVPDYQTADKYVDSLAVRDQNVISASGLGAVEFAKEIFAELGIFGEDDLRIFEEMYRHGRVLADQ